MLQYAYKHKGGENNPQVKALPTDPNGYSHQHLQSLGIRNGLELCMDTSYFNKQELHLDGLRK